MVHLYGGNAEYPEPFVGRAFQNKPDGYAPEMDEDDGTMSGWYMFAQLGFYPLNVGTSEYEVFSPLFKRATIKTGGHKIRIKTSGRKSYDDPVKEILVDGKKLDVWEIDHSVFNKDSKIVFKY
jgi:putative alpha-1,2-mannosidase